MNNSLNLEELRVKIEEVEAGPSNANVLESTSNQQTSNEIFDKYLSGEIPLDNYEMLLEEEYAAKDGQTSSFQISKKMPPYIKALIGEANMQFARGDHETAKKMCYEIIRQYCYASEPYMILAQIFETIDPNKCLEYYTVAALSSPRNVDLWVRCAQLCVDLNNISQAIFCYTSALRIQPQNIYLHIKRIQWLRQESDNKNLLRSYMKMMEYLTPPYYNYLIQVAMRVASDYHNLKEYNKAVEALKFPFQKCPNLVTPQMLNIMLELLLITENYSWCLDLFLEHCNIEIEIVINEDNIIEIVSYNMPDNIQIDLRVKFIICAIQLKSFNLLESLLKPLIEMEDIETVGDLFLDITEVLMSASRYFDALKLLVPLIKSRNYSLAAVWLKYADCQSACEFYDEAISSYQTVLEMMPSQIEVKYNLAKVYVKLNQKSRALTILHQEQSVQEINVKLLIFKIKLLKDLEDYDEYWASLELLLSRHCETIRYFEEIRALTYLERPYEKFARLKKLRQLRGEMLDEKPKFNPSIELNVDEEYALLKEALELCVRKKKFAVMQKLVFMALSSPRFKNRYDELNLIGFFACIYNRDCYHAYPMIREIVIHNSNNNLAWNLFNVLLQRTDDLGHIRFMMRFLSSYMENNYLKLLEANYCLSVGNIKIGLGYYLNQLRRSPSAETCFSLGRALLQIFDQRFTENKGSITKTIIALFLKYSQMRSHDAYEEINFNLGRLYHHLGLLHLAKYYYESVLEYDGPFVRKFPKLSLKREAAFNLHIIYKNSKNYVAARNLLIKYVRI